MRLTTALAIVTLFTISAVLILSDVGDLFEPEAAWDGGTGGTPAAMDSSGVVMVVGDIANCESAGAWNSIVGMFDGRLAWAGLQEELPSEAQQVADLIGKQPGIVLALGDLTYPEGEADDFHGCFARLWVNLLSRTFPVPGNHEYKSDAEGYQSFWRQRAGPAPGFFYSFDYAGWHLVALNSEIDAGPGSEQALWLDADLSHHRAGCVLAFDHRPAFSIKKRPDDEDARALFAVLHRHGATTLLSGHSHFYERTEPLDASGKADPTRGLRQFIVGTGGHQLDDMSDQATLDQASFTEKLITNRWGALRIDLSNNRYNWAFLAAPDGEVLDSGHGVCVARGG